MGKRSRILDDFFLFKLNRFYATEQNRTEYKNYLYANYWRQSNLLRFHQILKDF